jgi:hypothetical protein
MRQSAELGWLRRAVRLQSLRHQGGA